MRHWVSLKKKKWYYLNQNFSTIHRTHEIQEDVLSLCASKVRKRAGEPVYHKKSRYTHIICGLTSRIKTEKKREDSKIFPSLSTLHEKSYTTFRKFSTWFWGPGIIFSWSQWFTIKVFIWGLNPVSVLRVGGTQETTMVRILLTENSRWQFPVTIHLCCQSKQF